MARRKGFIYIADAVTSYFVAFMVGPAASSDVKNRQHSPRNLSRSQGSRLSHFTCHANHLAKSTDHKNASFSQETSKSALFNVLERNTSRMTPENKSQQLPFNTSTNMSNYHSAFFFPLLQSRTSLDAQGKQLQLTVRRARQLLTASQHPLSARCNQATPQV